MKIAYLVWDCGRASGGLRIIFEQANHLIARGHQVEIWHEHKMNDQPPLFCKARFFLWRELKEPATDILVITDLTYVVEVIGKIKAGKYFFFAQHDVELTAELSGAESQTATVRKILGNFPSDCRLISLSSWIRDRLASKYRLPSMVVPGGVDLEIFHSARPLIDVAEPVVLFFYDAQCWKGFGDACAAVSLLRTTLPVRTMMVGAYLPKLFDGSEEVFYSFSWPMIFFNRPAQEDMARIFSSAAVFVSSSWVEGFGLPGLEAMACGVPVVTTDSGGVREYAVDRENCLMVPPKDPQSIADAVMKILKDEKLKNQLVKNGLETAKKFNWEKSVDALEKAFNE